MKKIITLLLLSISFFCHAQEKKKQNDIRLAINKVIIKHLDNKLLSATPTDFVHLYSITIAFDKAGKIKDVYFPKEVSNETIRAIRLDSVLIEKIKSLNVTYQQYASKLVLIPFFHYRTTDKGINYNSGFLNAIENLQPKVDNSKDQRDWVVLNVVINPFNLIIN
ncbi:hypothetical protein [Pedobacter rhizosphaerae]|uniref:Uncharacterized protein n=1 Tax=Pedobacter rhizosphaerae TaxID=390241 RepID=A0A1H9VPG5_9SPHI|nr:hypothetical protein [Pedobacter rhizosphaerae]SES23237.1 hypothetical protein SAMN04488023_1462 [Pedobacter rhizosphaerae]